MKKFWIIFIALLLGAVIGVGIWHGIAYGDKIKVVAEEAWQKIESVFKKDDDEHVHEFGEWSEVLAATCTEPGQERRTCDCGEFEEREVEALGHNYSREEINAKASCAAAMTTVDGHVVFVGSGVECSSFDCVDADICPHQHLSTIVHTCRTCGHSYSEYGSHYHTYNMLSDTATCSESGVRIDKCDYCGYVYERESVALGHTFVNCKCKYCGIGPKQVLINTDFDDMTGHEFDISFSTCVRLDYDDNSLKVVPMNFEKLLVGSCTKLGTGISFVDADGNEYAFSNSPAIDSDGNVISGLYGNLATNYFDVITFDDYPTGEIVDWLSANAREYHVYIEITQ